jgi:23S rRNA (uracil1939-C5)-methyltransferase
MIATMMIYSDEACLAPIYATAYAAIPDVSSDDTKVILMNTWPDELELALTGMAQGGAAVGHYEGRVVFATGGLPNEQVRVQLHERQQTFARGRVVQVLHPAAERIVSPCPLETVCGAADWRWIAYDAQIRFKTEILRDQLRHIGGIDVPVQPPAVGTSADPLASYAYRTTADLHVDGLRIGYYQPGSRHVVDLPACCLHHPTINAALDALRPLLSPKEIALRGITIRCSPATGEVLGVLDARGAMHTLARRWRQAYPALVGVVRASDGSTLDGCPFLEQRVAGVRFRVGAGSFFQVNDLCVEELVARVRTLLAPQHDSRLLDLYCGVGLFALPSAQNVAAVTGIEEWAPAVEDARYNAELNHLHNATFYAGTVEHVLATIAGSFDRVILDPPRRGCTPEVLHTLAQQGPQQIVYVSCHPGTLARDCRRLIAAGYYVSSAEVIDLFPHTHHIESIVLLERR